MFGISTNEMGLTNTIRNYNRSTSIQSLFINSIQNIMLNRPHIFLDLDNTIINALTQDEIDQCHKSGFYPEERLLYHDFKISDGGKRTMLYRIYERPYAQSFLDYLFTNFDVSVFTAADNDYASFIVDNVINRNGRKIKYFFYGYHAEITAKSMLGLKDLELLWSVYDVDNLSPNNTLILDDNDEVYKTNKENCIQCPAFSVYDEDYRKPNPISIEDEYLRFKCINILNRKLLQFQNYGTVIDKQQVYNKDYLLDKYIYNNIF